MLVPRAWTDRDVAPVPARSATGEPVRVSLPGLVRLCAALRVMPHEGVDAQRGSVNPVDPADLHSPVIDDSAPSPTSKPSELAGAVASRARQRRRDVGVSRPGGGARVTPDDGGTP